MKDYGQNAVLTSICARNLSDDSRSDFGFRPALGAVLERLQLLGQR